MKIHFLLTKGLLKGGGIETYTRGIGSRLVQRGHDVTVYSTRGDDGTPPVVDGMKVIWLPKIRPYWMEKFCGAAMAAYLEMTARDSPEIIHLHSVAAGAMAAFLRHQPAPCIVQMHGVEWKRSRWGAVARTALRTLEQCSFASCDAVTAVSKTQCDYYAGQYGAHCEYIPTAVELKAHAMPRLITELGLRPRQYVLFAARLVAEKGAQHLIPAFRSLATNCDLVIAGEGSEASRRQLAEMAGDDRRIRFLGDVRGRLLEELFSNARVFTQPSELEGLSIGLIEAMSYGLQCVASDIPENREAIGDAGLVFRNKDTADLGRVLEIAIRDEAGAAALGARARRRVVELFGWDRVVSQMEALYRATLERKLRVAYPVHALPATMDSGNAFSEVFAGQALAGQSKNDAGRRSAAAGR